jgi:hypothetical protein
MKIADTITVTIAGEPVTLHPALRHAIRLERRPGSFAALVQEVIDGSLTAACDLIGDHLDMTPHTQDAVFNVLPDLRDPLLAYVMALAGIDADDMPANDNGKSANLSASRKTVPIGEHLTGLYRLGTGWLGWSPADTLDATPAEIREAYAGRLDMLKSIFGGSDDATASKSDLPLDDKIKTAFAGFTTIKVSRKKAG